MTLILGFYSNAAMVLTVDGRCTENWQTGEKQVSDNNQKIFPIPDLPIAIVHHGERRINNCDIKDIVGKFILNNLDYIRINLLQEIADKLKQYIDLDVKARLKEIEWLNTSVGLWVAGFSPNSNQPEIYEVFWKYPNDASISKFKGDLNRAGDAARFVDWYIDKHSKGEYGSSKIHRANIKYLAKCHNEIYVLAERIQKSKGENIFGGHKHQLAITKLGWEWIIPPPQ